VGLKHGGHIVLPADEKIKKNIIYNDQGCQIIWSKSGHLGKKDGH
jgi:hypothetical protein